MINALNNPGFRVWGFLRFHWLFHAYTHFRCFTYNNNRKGGQFLLIGLVQVFGNRIGYGGNF